MHTSALPASSGPAGRGRISVERCVCVCVKLYRLVSRGHTVATTKAMAVPCSQLVAVVVMMVVVVVEEQR